MVSHKTHKPAATLAAHKGAVNVVTFNSDGNYCMTGGDDRRVVLWNPHRVSEDGSPPAPIKEYLGHNQRVLDVAVASDNASFASCGGDRAVFVWDVTSGTVVRKLLGHEQRVNTCRYNADCSVLVTASYDRTVRCWDMRSRNANPVQILAGSADSVSSVLVTGHEIVAGSIDGCVQTYDLRAGRVTRDSIGVPVTHVAMSHDGQCLLAATLDSTLRLLDRATGGLLCEYRGHTNTAFKLACCLSRDDASVLCGSEDGSLHAWDLVEAKPLAQLQGHAGPLVSVSTHPKLPAMLTASHDGTAKLWLRS